MGREAVERSEDGRSSPPAAAPRHRVDDPAVDTPDEALPFDGDLPLGRVAMLLMGLVIAPISAWLWVADMNARARVDVANDLSGSGVSHGDLPLPEGTFLWPALTILGLALLGFGLSAVLPSSDDDEPAS